MDARPGTPPGSAVIVHGTWSNPGDMGWVRRLLEHAGVHVEAPDLPSHRSARAGLLEDADEVRRVIRSCPPPVVAIGWSYGCDVIGVAADGEGSVIRLIYAGAVPCRVGIDPERIRWVDSPPWITADYSAGTFVLDNDWWVYEEKGTTFPPDVQEHIRRNPRRPAAIRINTDPIPAAAWKSIGTTVLLGVDDELVTDEERRWAAETFDDVRAVDTDHFLLFHRPEVVAGVALEALRDAALPR
ncbi:alpha/beta hydrolase [Lysobacter korlensis]|uniref:Alpha/beta hydrolase n=1 Tax=Lysobacter korlensis TaxID=553636 RepID=A0ABV6RZS0_9GAMM